MNIANRRACASAKTLEKGRKREALKRCRCRQLDTPEVELWWDDHAVSADSGGALGACGRAEAVSTQQAEHAMQPAVEVVHLNGHLVDLRQRRRRQPVQHAELVALDVDLKQGYARHAARAQQRVEARRRATHRLARVGPFTRQGDG
eukprot:6206763-Pleurochrysis_carterae.AAC.7